MKILLSLLALCGLVAPASACNIGAAQLNYGYQTPAVAFATVCYAQPAALVVQSYAVQQQTAYAVPACASAQVQTYSGCPAAQQQISYADQSAVVVQQTECPVAVVQQLQTYALPQAVQVLCQQYGYSAVQAVQFLRLHNHREALAYAGTGAEFIVGDGVNGVGRDFGDRDGKRKIRKKKIRVKK